MAGHGGPAIVADHIDMVGGDGSWGQIPGGMMLDMGFCNPLAVDIQFALSKFNRFTRQSNYPFEQHNASSGETDGHHVKALERGKEILWSPAEGERTVPVGGFHAVSLDSKGNEEITEQQITGKGYHDKAKEVSSIQGGKEKAVNERGSHGNSARRK